MRRRKDILLIANQNDIKCWSDWVDGFPYRCSYKSYQRSRTNLDQQEYRKQDLQHYIEVCYPKWYRSRYRYRYKGEGIDIDIFIDIDDTYVAQLAPFVVSTPFAVSWVWSKPNAWPLSWANVEDGHSSSIITCPAKASQGNRPYLTKGFPKNSNNNWVIQRF